MYTAKIINKEYVGAALRVSVEFSDGVTTVVETCIPQDEAGFKFWVKSRLTTFNSGKTIDSTTAIDDVVDVADPVVVPPTPTAEEIARDAWLTNYRKWIKIKSTLIDTGVLTGSETKLVQLKAKVTSDFLPAYLDII